MRSPSPPEPPDPYRVATANQLASIEVAQANTALANADMETPEAQVTFEETVPIDITTYQYDTSGNLTGTTARSIRRWKKVTTLKPATQTIFDQQQTLSQNFNAWAINQITQLQSIMANPLDDSNLTARLASPSQVTLTTTSPTPGPLVETIGSTDLTTHLRTTREAINFRVDYQIDRDREKMIDELDKQGIYPGSRAYDRALATYDFASTDAWHQSYLAAQQEQTRIVQLEGVIANFANQVQQHKFDQAVSVIEVENSNLIRQFQIHIDLCNYINTLRQQQLQEESTVRSQTVNEVSSLSNGGRVQVPNFHPYRGGQVATTPVGDYVYRSAAARLQNYQMQVSQQQQMMGGILGFAGNMLGGAMALGGGLFGGKG